MYFHFWTLLNYPHYSNISASICLVWAITICSPNFCSSIVFSIWSPFIFFMQPVFGWSFKMSDCTKQCKTRTMLFGWLENHAKRFGIQYICYWSFGEPLTVPHMSSSGKFWSFGCSVLFLWLDMPLFFSKDSFSIKLHVVVGTDKWQCCKMKYYFLLRPSIMLFYVFSLITIIMCSRSIVVVRNFLCHIFHVTLLLDL